MEFTTKNIFITAGSLYALTLIIFGVHGTDIQYSFASLESALPASVFFTDSTTKDGILGRYTDAKKGGEPLKIMIVAGHDTEVPGATYRNLREADMTVKLAEKLSNYFSADKEFKTILTRTAAGYNPAFLEYRTKEKDTIATFIKAKKQDMGNLIKIGSLHEYVGVQHNKASDDGVTTLYATNNWANETKADLVIHIHFNDMAGRAYEVPGDYTGFSVYVPEKQYSNARASKNVAEPIFKRLSTFYPISNLPLENAGIVESQDLIAVGAYNTLDSAGMLIEYSYIYEPQFDTKVGQDKTIDELAWQTYLGINDFFKTDKAKTLPLATGLSNLTEEADNIPQDRGAVLDLQKALLLTGAYPPAGKTLEQCPLSGNFGNCTKTALTFFQTRDAISGEKGRVGVKTLESLHQRLSVLDL